VGNVELRSRPLQVSTLQMAAVIFHDIGNAVSSFSTLAPRSSIGTGLRILFPQLDRSVLRFDVAVPLNRAPESLSSVATHTPTWVITLEQAFSPPDPSATVAAPSVGTPNPSTSLGPTMGWLGQ